MLAGQRLRSLELGAVASSSHRISKPRNLTFGLRLKNLCFWLRELSDWRCESYNSHSESDQCSSPR